MLSSNNFAKKMVGKTIQKSYNEEQSANSEKDKSDMKVKYNVQNLGRFNTKPNGTMSAQQNQK